MKHHDRDSKDVRRKLYDLAAEEGLETRILGELDEAVALFKASPEYLHLLSTPSIPKKGKIKDKNKSKRVDYKCLKGKSRIK